jgi:hypothetical protein
MSFDVPGQTSTPLTRSRSREPNTPGMTMTGVVSMSPTR